MTCFFVRSRQQAEAYVATQGLKSEGQPSWSSEGWPLLRTNLCVSVSLGWLLMLFVRHNPSSETDVEEAL